jgi:16S rRNA (cytosine1402-N4)-methyltransferase
MAEHISVLLHETVDSLNIKENGIYVDLTLGRAGHSKLILSKLNNEGLLIGVDQDIEAIKASDEILKSVSTRYKLVHSNFEHIKQIIAAFGISYVDGIMMDLGVSSPQFDNASRGFSYREDAPLDMRMDQSSELTAKEVVNTYSFKELCRVFRDYGDEKYTPSIANNIIKYRENKKIETTLELVEIIKRSKPMKELSKPGHPAKQVFQALRIEVNNELNVLKKALKDCLDILKPGGRLSVITFHSGEDKIVKSIFKEYSTVEGNRYDIPLITAVANYKLVNTKVIVPSEDELANNRRSASAKLRIIERK